MAQLEWASRLTSPLYDEVRDTYIAHQAAGPAVQQAAQAQAAQAFQQQLVTQAVQQAAQAFEQRIKQTVTQAVEAAMQPVQQQLVQRMDRLEQRMERVEVNVPCRVANGRAGPDSEVVRLQGAGGQVPDTPPMTLSQLAAADTATVGPLLAVYGLPTDGGFAEKRSRLARYLGLPWVRGARLEPARVSMRL